MQCFTQERECDKLIGPAGLFAPPRRRGPSAMTEERARQAEQLSAAGHSRAEVARRIGVVWQTLKNHIRAGRIAMPAAEAEVAPGEVVRGASDVEPTVDRGAREARDLRATMGRATRHTTERQPAAIGQLDEAQPRFPEAFSGQEMVKGAVCLVLSLCAVALETSPSFDFWKAH